MNINEAYEQLNVWIDLSQGILIDVGLPHKYSFSRTESFSEDRLISFESQNNISLPTEYREFLKEVGAVDILSTEKTAGIEILSPYTIRGFSKEVFDNAGDDLYPDLLLTTSMPKTGDVGGFWMKGDPIQNYGIFYPEMPPEFWVKDTEFTTFNDWFIELIEEKINA
ncbi:SMI1/KNR4 family protein [Salmonella enterica]|nr:SMI1/KNR4 family protein [Salmonella enterica subsp. salamae]EEP0951936.1 SMI1/KNR4 family protein [Salmonella enterica]EEP0974876.1 SMI1/KNR4 family protein [Salmonella enterica]EEP1007137.1 SMI1/KNR4 family protein [Salmonella enterica]EEP1011796.1 SMI1/KNR4 family protein [Salmonella enterica]